MARADPEADCTSNVEANSSIEFIVEIFSDMTETAHSVVLVAETAGNDFIAGSSDDTQRTEETSYDSEIGDQPENRTASSPGV